MKKKLLIIVGAGPSLDFGLPSVADIDRLFDYASQKIFPLSNNPSSNLYRHFSNAICQYYNGMEKLALRKITNFEEILYQINLLAPYLTDADYSHGSNALLSPKVLPDILENGVQKIVDRNTLHNLSDSLVS